MSSHPAYQSMTTPELVFAANSLADWLDEYGFDSDGQQVVSLVLLRGEAQFQGLVQELEARGESLVDLVTCPD